MAGNNNLYTVSWKATIVYAPFLEEDQYLYFTHRNPRTLIMNSLKPSMNLILLSLLIIMFSDGGVSLLKASNILCLYVGSAWSCNNWLTYSLYSTCQQKNPHVTICLASINGFYVMHYNVKTFISILHVNTNWKACQGEITLLYLSNMYSELVFINSKKL